MGPPTRRAGRFPGLLPGHRANSDSGDRRQSRAASILRSQATRRRWWATSCFTSGRPAAGEAARRIVGEDRADHEDRRATGDDGERNPVDLAVERKADQLDRMGKGIGLANVIKPRASLLNSP